MLVALLSAAGWALGDHSAHSELRVVDYLARRRSDDLTRLAKGLSALGSQPVLIVFAALVAGCLYWRHRRTEILTVIGTTTGALVLPAVVKVIVDRRRPTTHHLTHVASAGFPSGHAAQSAAILLVLAWAMTTDRHRRAAAMFLAATTAAAVGWSRVYLGVHYPTDVVAGWLLGAAWMVFTTGELGRSRRPPIDSQGLPAH